MEEITINIEGKENTLKIRGIKNKLQKRFLKNVSSLSKDSTKLGEYVDFEYELIEKTTGLTEDQIDELEIEEKSKIMNKLFEIMTGSMDFTNASKSPQPSTHKEKETL